MKINSTKKQYTEPLNLVFFSTRTADSRNTADKKGIFDEIEQNLLSQRKKM